MKLPLLLKSFTAVFLVFPALAEHPIAIVKPEKCVRVLDEGREIGGDEFWRFEVDYESRTVLGPKKQILRFSVDSHLERLLWSSTLNLGHEGRLDLREGTLDYRLAGAFVESHLEIFERPQRAANILREAGQHAQTAAKFTVNQERLEILACLGELLESYAVAIQPR